MQSEIIFTHSSYLLHYFSITVLDLEQRKKYLNCFHLNYTYLFKQCLFSDLNFFFLIWVNFAMKKIIDIPPRIGLRVILCKMQIYERRCISKKLIEVLGYISIAIKVNLVEFLFTQLSFEH